MIITTYISGCYLDFTEKNGGGTGGSKAVVSAVASVVKKMAVDSLVSFFYEKYIVFFSFSKSQLRLSSVRSNTQIFSYVKQK